MDFTNRSFLFGDGFFETMRFANGKVQLLPLHLQRAKLTAESLKMQWPNEWDQPFFEQMIFVLREDAVVRITFYRSGLGTYSPTESNMKLALSTRPLVERGLWLNQNQFDNKTLFSAAEKLKCEKVVLYHQNLKYADSMSNIKSTSAQFYVQAGIFLQEVDADDLILLNHYGRVCEGLNSNILVYLDGAWLTPALSEGPINGIFLNFLSSIISIKRVALSAEDLNRSDVCLFTNSVSGIRRFKWSQ